MSNSEWFRILSSPSENLAQPLVLLEGKAAVEAAVAGWWEVLGVLLDEEHPWEGPAWSGLEIVRRDRDVLDQLGDPRRHGGVLALANQPEDTTRVAEFMSGLAEDALLVVCPRPATPLVCGSLIKVASEHGAVGVLFGKEGASPFDPEAIERSATTVFQLPVRVSDGGQLLRCLKAAGVELVGTDPSGEPVEELPTEGRRALVVGDPEEGLGGFWTAVCDVRVSGQPEELLPKLR